MKSVFVKTTSHRARDQLERLLGYQSQGYCRFGRRGDWRAIPAARLADALKIPGVHRCAHRPKGVMKYIDWDDKVFGSP